MLRDQAFGARPAGTALLPLVLAAAAVAAALLTMNDEWPGAFAALAVVLTAAACALAGSLWHRQSWADRLADARQQNHLLLQLADGWFWQTDANHQLVRLQPPQGAPASAWAANAHNGQLLWERFIDLQTSLQARLQAHAALPDTVVQLAPAANPSAAAQTWRLRGLPRLDARGVFAGHVGMAYPLTQALAEPLNLHEEAAAATPEKASAGPSHEQALADEHAAFSYTVSHDLRAPLRVVEGFGRILKEDYGHALDRIGNDHLDRMVSAAARMNHMIDALLTLSKLSAQPLLRQPVNLSLLAQFVLDDLQRAAPERQVVIRIQPGLMAQGDPTLLRMALDNLLGNAWKYSARQASAEIGFERREQDGRPVYVVSDNGAGFDMRFADRLFGVFQRLHSSREFAGSGVGLASVQRIVRRHGGQIWAESAVGAGARLFFTLGA